MTEFEEKRKNPIQRCVFIAILQLVDGLDTAARLELIQQILNKIKKDEAEENNDQ